MKLTREQKTALVANYIKRIKNNDKRIYARFYWAYLNGNMENEPSSRLSYMAAQAVRLKLASIWHDVGE